MPGTEKHSLELIYDSIVILCSFVSDYRHARLVENFLERKEWRTPTHVHQTSITSFVMITPLQSIIFFLKKVTHKIKSNNRQIIWELI